MTKQEKKERLKLTSGGYNRIKDMKAAPGNFTPTSHNGVTDVPYANFYFLKIGDELIPQKLVRGTPQA